MKHLEVLSGAPQKKVCFYDLGGGTKAKFDARTPRAMLYFATKYNVPIIKRPADLTAFDVVLFSLLTFRDFFHVARIARFKGKHQEWIAGGNAVTTPTGVMWIMDYVWVGDCRDSFPKVLAGERDLPGLLSAKAPHAPIAYVDEDIDPEPFDNRQMEMSKGCPRRCLFCIHPWRHRYQEAPKEVVKEFITSNKAKGLGLMSNSSDDVSYYHEVAKLLDDTGKMDMVVSNAVQGLTEEMVSTRKRELLIGVEGMSERLRWIVNKPISRDLYREKVDLCLRHGKQVHSVYQFNLPGEDETDWRELEEDVEHFRTRYTKGLWILTFIPSQPSAHTPFQWVVPRYSVVTYKRINALRTRLLALKGKGLTVFVPSPLGAAGWFAQVVAEWIAITPTVADAFDSMPNHLTVRGMLDHLETHRVRLPPAFFKRSEHTVFPWANIATSGDDPDKWKRYQQMLRKMASQRFARAAHPSPEMLACDP